MPSPLKSPVPTTVQLVGTVPSEADDITIAPLIKHTARSPLRGRTDGGQPASTSHRHPLGTAEPRAQRANPRMT
jgi:hypothetical protein